MSPLTNPDPKTIEAALRLRTEELRRRVRALPSEVESWRARVANIDDRDMRLHFTQLQALNVLMTAYFEQQKSLLDALDPAGPSAAWAGKAFELVKSIIASQRVWSFFRSKLDLRFSPEFKDVLRVADIVAMDCYGPAMTEATVRGIVKKAAVREPPLTYLIAEFSPATWVRNSRPQDGRAYDLGEAQLPIPVIQVPWDHVENTWEFLSLHHEVGHDIEADLALRAPIHDKLLAALRAGGVPETRLRNWMRWQAEIFADFAGLQLGGPAFSDMLLNLLILPSAQVTAIDAGDPHPNHYVRILLNVASVRTMAAAAVEPAFAERLRADAAATEAVWLGLFGDQADLRAYEADFAVVIAAVMDTPYAALKGASVREMLPYTNAHDQRIRGTAQYLATGANAPPAMPPRHVISAARIAATSVLRDGDGAARLDDIDKRAARLVSDNQPEGLRARPYPKARADAVRRFVQVDIDQVLGPEN
jgi:hypothetical protein